MKREKKFWIFVTVLVSFLCTAVGLEAQEIKFDGYVNSGLGLWISNETNKDDPMVMVYGVDSGRFVGRFRLNGSYTNRSKNAGINFRIQSQGRGVGPDNPANALSLAFGYAWVRLLDMINIKAGLVNDTTWRTGDVIFDDDQGEGVGALFRVSPIEGLDLGFGAFVGSYGTASRNNFLDRLDEQLKWDDVKYTFNMAYTMDKTFRFMASYRTHNETGGDVEDNGSSQVLAELRLLAVDNLTAVVVGRIDGLEEKGGRKFDENGTISFYETFDYKMGALRFGLNAAQYVSNENGADLGLLFNPWVNYTFSEGNIVPRLDLAYFMGGERGNDTNYDRLAFVANYDRDSYVMNIRPSVKLNLDSRNSFEIGDSIYYSKQSNSIDSVIINVVYIDLAARF